MKKHLRMLAVFAALTLASTGTLSAQVTCPPTMICIPAPVVAPTPSPVDIQKAILDAVTQLVVVEKDTNVKVTTATVTFGTVVTWLGKYVAPAVISVLTTLKATGKI